MAMMSGRTSTDVHGYSGRRTACFLFFCKPAWRFWYARLEQQFIERRRRLEWRLDALRVSFDVHHACELLDLGRAADCDGRRRRASAQCPAGVAVWVVAAARAIFVLEQLACVLGVTFVTADEHVVGDHRGHCDAPFAIEPV